MSANAGLANNLLDALNNGRVLPPGEKLEGFCGGFGWAWEYSDAVEYAEFVKAEMDEKEGIALLESLQALV